MWKTLLRKCATNIRKHWHEIAECTVIGVLFVGFFVGGYIVRGVSVQEEISFWKSLLLASEPELCAICEDGNGNRCHAPALVNLSTGTIRELEIYDSDPTRPWEVAEEQRWDDWVFSFIDGNATMSWSSEDHTNIAHIGEKIGKIAPALFCHDCRALLADTATKGYALLDMYDLDNIQAFAVEDGAEYSIRDYIVSIYKDKENGGLSVEVTGHLFETEKPVA